MLVGDAPAGRVGKPDQIRSQLRMAPQAIVLLNHVLFRRDVLRRRERDHLREALRRVAEYLSPSWKRVWWATTPTGTTASPTLLSSLASGMTLGEAYESYHDYNAATVQRLQHPRSPSHVLWLDYDDWADWPAPVRLRLLATRTFHDDPTGTPP